MHRAELARRRARRRGGRAVAGAVARLIPAEVFAGAQGSGALGLVETAAGRLDGYLELHMNAWDAAAARAIARAAGCWTTAFDSGDWLARGNPIGAGAPALGPRLAALLRA
jgi:myo-inositol-1(or 4)-monophosphatase